MRAVLPIYEGDSIIHYGASLALPESTVLERPHAGRSPWAALGEAVSRFFRRLETSAERARYRRLEDYLADSGDVFELERRIRRIERGNGALFDPYS